PIAFPYTTLFRSPCKGNTGSINYGIYPVADPVAHPFFKSKEVEQGNHSGKGQYGTGNGFPAELYFSRIFAGFGWRMYRNASDRSTIGRNHIFVFQQEEYQGS